MSAEKSQRVGAVRARLENKVTQSEAISDSKKRRMSLRGRWRGLSVVWQSSERNRSSSAIQELRQSSKIHVSQISRCHGKGKCSKKAHVIYYNAAKSGTRFSKGGGGGCGMRLTSYCTKLTPREFSQFCALKCVKFSF